MTFKNDNYGYILLEKIIALLIACMIIPLVFSILLSSLKDWNYGESYLDMSYNARESINKLTNEIRDSCGVEILDSSDNGWIKLYKSVDNTEFITFRKKNDKLFIGYNNTLNSNSEFANHIKSFKINYLPLGVTNLEDVSGINISIVFLKDKSEISKNFAVALRY